MSRRDDGPLTDYAMTFVDLPLWCAPIGAAIMYVSLAFVPGYIAGKPLSSVTLVVVTMLKGLAPWAAGAVLLAGLVGAVKRATNAWIAGKKRPGVPVSPGVSPSMASPVPAAGAAPSCPRCGGPMVQRVARKGASAGQAFWGCQGYPKCKGTVG